MNTFGKGSIVLLLDFADRRRQTDKNSNWFHSPIWRLL